MAVLGLNTRKLLPLGRIFFVRTLDTRICREMVILDDINDAIYRGIIASGLFIKAAAKEAAEE